MSNVPAPTPASPTTIAPPAPVAAPPTTVTTAVANPLAQLANSLASIGGVSATQTFSGATWYLREIFNPIRTGDRLGVYCNSEGYCIFWSSWTPVKPAIPPPNPPRDYLNRPRWIT